MGPGVGLGYLLATLLVVPSLVSDGIDCQLIEGAADLISRSWKLINVQSCMLFSGLDYTNVVAVSQADTCKKWIVHGLLTPGVSDKACWEKARQCMEANDVSDRFEQCLLKAMRTPNLSSAMSAAMQIPWEVLSHSPLDLLHLAVKTVGDAISVNAALFRLQLCMFDLDYTDRSSILQAETCKSWIMQGLMTPGVSEASAYQKGVTCAKMNGLPESFQRCLCNAYEP